MKPDSECKEDEDEELLDAYSGHIHVKTCDRSISRAKEIDLIVNLPRRTTSTDPLVAVLDAAAVDAP